MPDYSFNWICGDCGKSTTHPLTKREAAFFDSFDMRKYELCEFCKSTKMESSSFSQPTIDEALLSEWCLNSSLTFLSQDQDLLLADCPFHLLEKYYLHEETVEQQRYWLLNAILVKLHDEIFSNDRERSKLVRFLIERRSEWEASTPWPYIVEGVNKKIAEHET